MKVNCVIVTYNRLALLKECLAAIEKQTYPIHKVIVIDNCSTDSSRTIIRTLGKRDSHVQYIFNIKNFGFSRSTFYGLTQAKGDCVVLLFADMQDLSLIHI